MADSVEYEERLRHSLLDPGMQTLLTLLCFGYSRLTVIYYSLNNSMKSCGQFSSAVIVLFESVELEENRGQNFKIPSHYFVSSNAAIAVPRWPYKDSVADHRSHGPEVSDFFFVRDCYHSPTVIAAFVLVPRDRVGFFGV